MIKRQLRYGWGGWIRTNDHGIKTRYAPKTTYYRISARSLSPKMMNCNA